MKRGSPRRKVDMRVVPTRRSHSDSQCRDPCRECDRFALQVQPLFQRHQLIQRVQDDRTLSGMTHRVRHRKHQRLAVLVTLRFWQRLP